MKLAQSLMGSYEHTIDDKGRMAFPTKLREKLGLSFIVTIGTDGCLYVFSEEEWDNFTAKIRTLTGEKAKAAKMFVVKACPVEPDKQGRILIPQGLRRHAGLTKDVTVIGVITHAEIWDTERWEKFNESVSEDMLADAISELAI